MTWKRVLAMLSTLVVLTSPAWGAYDANFTYDYLQTGPSTYTLTVMINNTSTDPAPLDYFQVFLDNNPHAEAYSNLVWDNSRGWANWIDPPQDAFGGIPGVFHADDSALGSGGGGIAMGATVPGFQLSFDFAAPWIPTDHLFAWHAEYGTDVNGNTMGSADGDLIYTPVTGVPEPGTLLLVGAGLAGMLFMRKRR